MYSCANCFNKLDRLKLSLGGGFSCSCTNCQTGKVMNCSRCKMVSYCSKECQQEHWKYSHKAVCRTLAGERTTGEELIAKMTCSADFYKRMAFPSPISARVCELLSDSLRVSWNVSDLQGPGVPDIVILPPPGSWIPDNLYYMIYLVAVLKG